ncbi:MAG: oligosaccharide flippase family protein, partial [Candidatus Staskawiczbacteria bacterium]|nr:oligosaccharide flippase family protein [Candidatus Staskawiczbacteria bacterium]
FGIATIAITLLESFSQTGFNRALVQKQGEIVEYLNTAWVVQVLRGFIITIILFFFSGSIANFFSAPEISLIIKIISITILLEGASSVAIIYASKNLEFHTYFIYQIVGSIAEFIFSIWAALIFKNYWALVIGFSAGVAVRFFLSYIIYPHRPKFSINIEKAKELINYSKWIFGSNIIGFFISQGESIFIGKFLGIASLGFYQMAYKISSFLNIEVVSGALFPAYAKVQDNAGALKKAYFKTLKLISLVFFPMAGGIFVLFREFTNIFLGAKWLPMVPSLKLLIWTSLFWAMSVVTGSLLQAIGKPNMETWLNGIRLILLLIIVYPLTSKFGIMGAALSVFFSVVVASFGYLFIVFRMISLKLKDAIDILCMPLLSTLLMIWAISYGKVFFSVGFLPFFGMVMSGVVIYFTLILIGEKVFNIKSFCLLKETLLLLIK